MDTNTKINLSETLATVWSKTQLIAEDLGADIELPDSEGPRLTIQQKLEKTPLAHALRVVNAYLGDNNTSTLEVADCLPTIAPFEPVLPKETWDVILSVANQIGTTALR